MAYRRKPTARNRTGSIDKNAARKNSAVPSLSLPNIAELIADGEITVGVLRPVGNRPTFYPESSQWELLLAGWQPRSWP